MLWKLRYRKPRHGMVFDQIEAEDFAQAEKVGRAYCQAHGNEMFSYVRIDGPVVVAGPEILKDGVARDQQYSVVSDQGDDK